MTDLTPERFREIEARCEAATKTMQLHATGYPWPPRDTSVSGMEDGTDYSITSKETRLVVQNQSGSWVRLVAQIGTREDAELFLNARKDLVDLLAALKHVTEERDGYAAALYWYAHPETWRQWPHADQGDRARIALSDPAECLKARDANLTAELRQFKQAANSIWRNQQMSTMAVASNLFNLIVKFVDHASVETENVDAHV